MLKEKENNGNRKITIKKARNTIENKRGAKFLGANSLRSSKYPSLSRNCQPFVELDGSLPCSFALGTGPYPVYALTPISLR
jgi:hypothetical protein